MLDYFTKPSNNSTNKGDDGLGASAFTTLPVGSINKNLGIELIPNALIKSDI